MSPRFTTTCPGYIHPGIASQKTYWLVRILSTVCVSLPLCIPGKPLAAGEPFVEDQSHEALEEGFQWLFDGESFEGWEGNLDYFRIENGAIVAGNLQRRIPNNEFLCTEKSFGDFELRLEARLIGEGQNAGVQFRSRRIPDHHEVIGYQCDMGVNPDRLIWGSLYDESRRREMLAEPPAEQIDRWVRRKGWNSLRIVARGNRVELFVNGHQTVNYTEPDEEIATRGSIGLQIHSGPPVEAWYRKVRIREFSERSAE